MPSGTLENLCESDLKVKVAERTRGQRRPLDENYEMLEM